MIRIAIGVLALALCLGAPRAATAQDRDPDLARAKKLHAQGKKLFSLLRFEEALEKFEDAFAAKPIPDFLFNVAQCHRNLENYDAAIFSFRRYLSLEPDTDRREHIEDLIRELEEDKKKAEDARRNAAIVPTPRPKPEAAPVYRRWWFWTGIAAVAAGTTAIVLTTRGDSGGLPGTDLGNLDFGQ